jgi:hypothetical protein
MTIPSSSYDGISNLGWWIEVFTTHPVCIYYFGPFADASEAHASQDGHLADLKREGAQIISVRTSFCQPRKLTIYEKDLTIHDLEAGPLPFFEALVLH